MPDMVSLTAVMSDKCNDMLTIGNDYQISLDNASILELYARQIFFDVDDFLTQAKLATCLEGSFVQELLVVSPSYRQISATCISLRSKSLETPMESLRRYWGLFWLV